MTIKAYFCVSAGTPASLSCGSMTLEDPGSPGGRYPGSAPCTSPAHTMDSHHVVHHAHHHSHQGLASLGRPTSRQDTMSPPTSAASSPSPPPAGQISLSNSVAEASAAAAASVGSGGGGASPAAKASTDDLSHDSYDLLHDDDDDDEDDLDESPYKNVTVVGVHRTLGRTRSDPNQRETCAQQLRLAKSEPLHQRRSDNVGRRPDDVLTDDDEDDVLRQREPFYANQPVCSHCRQPAPQQQMLTHGSGVRSEPTLCPVRRRLYSDDDYESSDQYAEARADTDAVPSSCSSPDDGVVGRRRRLPSPPPGSSVFYFPEPGERLMALPLPPPPGAFYPVGVAEIPPYSPRQPLVPDSPPQSESPPSSSPPPPVRIEKPTSSRPLKSPPPPSGIPTSPRALLSPHALLSPRCDSSSPSFFPSDGGIRSPKLDDAPPASPKVLMHQASVDFQDDDHMLPPAPTKELEYLLLKRQIQSDSGSGSESSSDQFGRRCGLPPVRRKPDIKGFVKLHHLPPTNAVSSEDDTMDENSSEDALPKMSVEQRRADVHTLKMAFMLSGVEEEELPRAIDSARITLADERQPSTESEESPYAEVYADERRPSDDDDSERVEEAPESPPPPPEQQPRRSSFSRMKSMSEESDDTETARTVVTPRHLPAFARTASMSEDSDVCLGSEGKPKITSDDSDADVGGGKTRLIPEIREESCELSPDERPATSIDSGRVTIEPRRPLLGEDLRQDSISELERKLIKALMRSSSNEEDASGNLSRQTSIDRVIMETTDPGELEKILIRAIMRSTSTEDESTLVSSIESNRVTIETTSGDSSDPGELEKALIRALIRNSSTDDETLFRQTSLDAANSNPVQQALELEKVLIRAIMKSSSEDDPGRTGDDKQSELERFILQSLEKIPAVPEELSLFNADKRRASCPMTQVEKDAAEFVEAKSEHVSVKPRRASEGGRNQTAEFHDDSALLRPTPTIKVNESLYHSTHDLSKRPTPPSVHDLFKVRREATRRSSYPPSSSEEDDAYVKPRQTRSSYVPSSSEEEELNHRAKTTLSDHALSRRTHIEGLRRAMLDSSGSSSLEDDNPVFVDSVAANDASVILEYALASSFPPARTLSRISERSTTSEHERSTEAEEEDESKLSSLNSDDTNSEISSAAARAENSLSSDPSTPGDDDDKTKEDSDQPQTVTASTFVAPLATNNSYLETFYLEVRAEQASPVTLPLDSSSTDENQQTLQDDSPVSLSPPPPPAPDFFTQITCTPPPPPTDDEDVDSTDWADVELPPPPPDFLNEAVALMETPAERRRPFIDFDYQSPYASGCHTLPRKLKQWSVATPTETFGSGANTLPRRHTKRSDDIPTGPFKGQRVIIPIKPASIMTSAVGATPNFGHNTLPRCRPQRDAAAGVASPTPTQSNTLPRARHRVAVSLDVHHGRVLLPLRPTTKQSDV